jgi:hypothetical protein
MSRQYYSPALCRAMRSAFAEAGSREVVEVIAVEPSGLRMHVKFAPTRQTAAYGVRGGLRVDRPNHAQGRARRHFQPRSRATPAQETQCSAHRDTRSRPRRISPRKKQKSLERLMALKIQHCAQRWMLRRQPLSNSNSSTGDTGPTQRSQSPTTSTMAAAPIAALAPPSSSQNSSGTVVPEPATSQGYCLSSHSSTAVLAPPPSSPLPPPSPPFSAGRSPQPPRAVRVARDPQPSRVDQAAPDTLSHRPPRRAATRSQQKSSGEPHLPKSRSGL